MARLASTLWAATLDYPVPCPQDAAHGSSRGAIETEESFQANWHIFSAFSHRLSARGGENRPRLRREMAVARWPTRSFAGSDLTASLFSSREIDSIDSKRGLLAHVC